MAIYASFNKSDDRVVKFLVKKEQKIRNSLFQEMKKIAIDLQSYVKNSKLSGQVLKNRTGNLRRAITQLAEMSDTNISAIVGVAPNASKYAAIHEFGGQIHVPAVEGKLMVFPTSLTLQLQSQTGKGKRAQATAAKLGGMVFTMKHRAFTVNMPERSYLRSSLRENKSKYLGRMSAAVERGAVGNAG